MSDVIGIFQGIVKKNSNKKVQDYRFPMLDSIVSRSKPYLLDISGDSESLKTRFGLYLANSLMHNGHAVYWISASDYNTRLADLEIEYLDRMVVLLDSNIHRILQFLRHIPEGSDVFIDSLISLHSENQEVAEHPYLSFGKACSEISEQRGLKVHILSPTSGMNFKPLSDVFNRKIHYRLRLKKVKSYKDFVGANYQVVGNYYHVACGEMQQVIAASLFQKINPDAVLFFWLVAIGQVEKIKKTYYYQGQSLGSKYLKIISDQSLMERLYSGNFLTS